MLEEAGVLQENRRRRRANRCFSTRALARTVLPTAFSVAVCFPPTSIMLGENPAPIRQAQTFSATRRTTTCNCCQVSRRESLQTSTGMTRSHAAADSSAAVRRIHARASVELSTKPAKLSKVTEVDVDCGCQRGPRQTEERQEYRPASDARGLKAFSDPQLSFTWHHGSRVTAYSS